MKSSVHTIKREQKKSLYLQKLTTILYQLSEEVPLLRNVYVSRIDLSADTGICYLYFATFPDATKSPEEVFDEALYHLKIYKTSIRKAFAQIIKARYCPDLMFLFDEKYEKAYSMNNLLAKVSDDLKEHDLKHQVEEALENPDAHSIVDEELED